MMDLEENILAAALLWWLSEHAEGVPGRHADGTPALVEAALYERYDAIGKPRRLVVLVANCERRFAVEKCEREVLEAADEWDRTGPYSMTAGSWKFRDVLAKLRAAREAL